MSNLFLSYNVGSSSNLAGLNQLITLYDPLIVFIQEVTITTEQLLTQVNSNFSGLSNIDENEPGKPGTAVLWRKELEVVVTNIVTLRLQLVKSANYGNFVNIYAPTGSQGEH